jgi:hypothetical protein
VIEKICLVILAGHEKEILQQKVDEIISTKNTSLSSDIKYNLTEFFKNDCFFKLFSHDSKFDDNIVSIDLRKAFDQIELPDNIKQNLISLMIFAYLKKLNNELNYSNTQPVIITLKTNIFLFINKFKEEIIGIFSELAKKHVVVIISCEDRNKLYKSKEIVEFIKNVLPTRFFLSDKFVDKQFKEIFNLSNVDINRIKMYSPLEYMFLLKQDDDSIVASFKVLNSI